MKTELVGILMFLTCFFVACMNKNKESVVADSVIIENAATIEKLHPAIVQGVSEKVTVSGGLEKYLRSEASLFPLDESFISITFIVRPEDKKFYSSDSLVLITYYSFDNNAPVNEYYKGIIDMVDYKVGIFDVGGFGDRYYNADSIKHVPLSEFRPYELAFIPTTILYVENGELKLWNP